MAAEDVAMATRDEVYLRRNQPLYSVPSATASDLLLNHCSKNSNQSHDRTSIGILTLPQLADMPACITVMRTEPLTS